MSKMTLEEFAQTYNRSPLDDEDYAEAIVRLLPEDLPIVKASQDFLDACKALDAAMEAAGIVRD